MTPVQTRANGFGTPSLPQLWLTVMLRVLAELVQSVCSTLQMTRRPDRVNATRATPPDLPGETSDTCKETFAVQHDSALTTVSHTSPSPSVSAIHLPLLRRWRQE